MRVGCAVTTNAARATASSLTTKIIARSEGVRWEVGGLNRGEQVPERPLRPLAGLIFHLIALEDWVPVCTRAAARRTAAR